MHTISIALVIPLNIYLLHALLVEQIGNHAEFTIGFVFDGHDIYENLSNLQRLKQFSILRVYEDPQLTPLQDVLVCDYLHIKIGQIFSVIHFHSVKVIPVNCPGTRLLSLKTFYAPQMSWNWTFSFE